MIEFLELKAMIENQQHLAGSVFFNAWHVVHTISISLQSSTQNGIQHRQNPKNASPKHHIKVTIPGVLLIKDYVLFLQTLQYTLFMFYDVEFTMITFGFWG